MTSSFISRSRDETKACFHACLNELPSELRGFAFQGTDLICIHCVSNESEFCRYSEGFYFRFVGLSRSAYKLCGKHMQTKKISHLCGCCEFACGRIIRWGKRPRADTNIKVLLVISRYKASQDSAIVSGLLTENSDLRSCFCILTKRHRRGQCEVCCEKVSLF